MALCSLLGKPGAKIGEMVYRLLGSEHKVDGAMVVATGRQVHKTRPMGV